MHQLSEKPKLSIVLGTYNRKKFLKLTIESIREEMKNFEYPFEIIVVDGGSDDGTLQWLAKQKDTVAIIQHNHGTWEGKPVQKKTWGYFMNLGFQVARGKYVCMLSDDCLVVPGSILNGYELFENRLEQGQKIGAVAFFWRDVPGPKKYWTGRLFNKTILVNHGIFLKKALEEVGYIDEDVFRFYYADGDLCLRICQMGYEIIESQNSYIEHYAHANVGLRNKNAENATVDKEAFFTRWAGNIGNAVEESSHPHIKEYHDELKTAMKFKRARPIEFYAIKSKAKHMLKKVIRRK